MTKINDKKVVEVISSGKVRDLYVFPNIIFRTSNRVSVFDRVISQNNEVPVKGAMLNCISQSNKVLLEKAGIKTDYIPVTKKFFKSVGFKSEEYGRLSCGQYLDMIKVEVIVRNYMVGSLEKAYNKGEAYCGLMLPAGIKKGEKLPYPIVTPTTKEEKGHDIPITSDDFTTYLVDFLIEKGYGYNNVAEQMRVFCQNGCTSDLPKEAMPRFFNNDDITFATERTDILWEQVGIASAHSIARKYVEYIYKTSLDIFNILSKNCEKNGIILVDTKLEFGFDKTGNIILADEVGTPDSSRFASLKEYKKTGKLNSMDKQIIRDYCSSVGFTGEENQVLPVVPDEIWHELSKTYIQIAEMLCGGDVVLKYLPKK